MKNIGHERKRPIACTSVSDALMVRGQYRRALELLDKVIEDPLPLFQGEDIGD